MLRTQHFLITICKGQVQIKLVPVKRAPCTPFPRHSKGPDFSKSPALMIFAVEVILVTSHHAHLLAQAALCFLLLALTLNTRLFVKLALLHFTEQPFLLQLALENPDRLFDVVVDDLDLHLESPRFQDYNTFPRGKGSKYNDFLRRMQGKFTP